MERLIVAKYFVMDNIVFLTFAQRLNTRNPEEYELASRLLRTLQLKVFNGKRIITKRYSEFRKLLRRVNEEVKDKKIELKELQIFKRKDSDSIVVHTTEGLRLEMELVKVQLRKYVQKESENEDVEQDEKIEITE